MLLNDFAQFFSNKGMLLSKKLSKGGNSFRHFYKTFKQYILK